MPRAVKFAGAQYRARRVHPLGPSIRRGLCRFDRASGDELIAFQERRLRALVRLVAARSPFYRQWFAESRTDPRDIRTLGDLEALPLLDRRVLAERPDDFLVYPRRLMWTAHSSGTTGTPVTVYRTPGSAVYERAALERQWGWFGIPRGARRAVLRGSTFASDDPSLVASMQPGTGDLLVSSYRLTADALPAILEALRRFRPDVVEGWPSSISLLAALLVEAGERFPVTGIVTSSEMLTTAQRVVMTEAFVGPIVDHYGQSERVVLAGDCEHGSFHVFADYGIAEFLPLPRADGRFEIVGTGLHNWGAPLLRYRTGDQVGPPAAARCGCGRSHPVVGGIDGRAEETFTGADGRDIPFPSTIIDELSGLREAQLRQRAPGRFDVLLVPGTGYDGPEVEARLRDAVVELFGPGQSLHIELVDRVPRSPSGKLKAAVVVNDLEAPSTSAGSARDPDRPT